MMSSSAGYVTINANLEIPKPTSETLIRHQFQRVSGAQSLRGDKPMNHFMDAEITEEEILVLRKQIADACVQELQLLNEKHVLERKLADLQMALEEKQNDAISNAFRELSQRKGYLEENIQLTNDLKVAEEDIYVLTSSLLKLLAEYDVRPPAINASTIANGAKRLYHQMHWKLRSSHVPNTTDFHHHTHIPSDGHLESTSNRLKFLRDHEFTDRKEEKFAPSLEVQHPFSPNRPRELGRSNAANFLEDNTGEVINRKGATEFQFYTGNMHEAQPSSITGGEYSLPGIEGFQIVGDAKPGSTLRACGYPSNGTSLCIFQWVRHLQNGTRQSIEGATVPDYVVTADDVDTLLAVDCIPMDDSGHQGELVSQFANNHFKITCDPEMQRDIDNHITAGRASFNVFMLNSSEEWDPVILVLKRAGYQIKKDRTDAVIMEEKYSPTLHIKVPCGVSTQFVLISSDGASVPFNTSGASQKYNTDKHPGLRDIIVLTMRIFQAKALDGKKKAKV